MRTERLWSIKKVTWRDIFWVSTYRRVPRITVNDLADVSKGKTITEIYEKTKRNIILIGRYTIQMPRFLYE